MINYKVSITKVSNGYIVVNERPEPHAETRVFSNLVDAIDFVAWLMEENYGNQRVVGLETKERWEDPA